MAKPRQGKDGKKGSSSEKVWFIFALPLKKNPQEMKEREAKARARAAKSAMRARSEAELRGKQEGEEEGGEENIVGEELETKEDQV